MVKRELRAYLRRPAAKDLALSPDEMAHENQLIVRNQSTWTKLVFLNAEHQEWNELACSHFPQTCQLLRKIPELHIVSTGIPTPLSPLFLGRFAPVFRRFSAVPLRCPASWRRDGENGRKMAENGRNLGEKRARNSGG